MGEAAPYRTSPRMRFTIGALCVVTATGVGLGIQSRAPADNADRVASYSVEPALDAHAVKRMEIEQGIGWGFASAGGISLALCGGTEIVLRRRSLLQEL